jgi:glutamyl/glutaminyl-tRNA synthetase
MIAKFELSRLQKSPAAFDLSRLDWMNGEYIRALTLSDLTDRLRPFVPAEWYDNPEYFEKVLTLDKDRMKRLDEARYIMEIFFESPHIDIDLLAKKESRSDIKQWLNELVKVLNINSFDHDELEKELRSLVDTLGIKTGQLFAVIRIALTGREQAPGLFDILATLGKDESLVRLNSVISQL